MRTLLRTRAWLLRMFAVIIINRNKGAKKVCYVAGCAAVNQEGPRPY